MTFNPYGPERETRRQASSIFSVLKERTLDTVCGYNYAIPFSDWLPRFERLLAGG
jgi:hydroxyacylglutathione hydrolase